jgi:hypothetical protein
LITRRRILLASLLAGYLAAAGLLWSATGRHQHPAPTPVRINQRPVAARLPAVPSESRVPGSRLPAVSSGLSTQGRRLDFGLASEPDQLGWMTSSGVAWKYRYTYIAGGVNNANNWLTWQDPALPPGQYALDYMNNTAAAGYIPAFTYYELLQSDPSTGVDESDRDYNNLNNASTMSAYYGNYVVLMQKAHQFGGQVIVHVEPDLWAYLEQRAGRGGSPASVSAMVQGSGFADVRGIPDTAAGFADALLKLRDQYAPNVVLATHASLWASGYDIGTNNDASLNVSGEADLTGSFLNAAGLASNPYGSTFDLVFNDVADHDAGWYGDNSHWWDRTNATLPNFSRWLTWMAELRAQTRKPLVVWQVPVGNQYFRTMDNTNGHYQDNRAEYFLAHPAELQAAGIQTVLFGAGNAGQTTYTDAVRDGITNPAPVNSFQCAGCNNHVSSYGDDDGGYLRIFVGRYLATPIRQSRLPAVSCRCH